MNKATPLKSATKHKNKMKKLILAVFILTSTLINAQIDSINKIYKDDFNTFVQLLEETHPDPYSAFGGQIEFKHTAQKMRKDIQLSPNDEAFRNNLMKFIAPLEDGHTFIYSTDNQANANEPNKFFPIVFKTASDGLFIDFTSEEYKHLIGNKLLSINGITIDSLLRKINNISPAENKYGSMFTLRNRIANQRFAATFLDKTSSVTLTLQDLQGKIQDIDIVYNENPIWHIPTSRLTTKNTNKLLYGQILENNPNVAYFAWNAVTSREVIEGIPPSNPRYKQMLNWTRNLMGIENSVKDEDAVMQIPELYGTFYHLLEEMKRQKSEYLIIDLRENTGGMTPLTLPLLYMLYGDKYLNYKSKAQYIQRISPLLLQKRGITLAEFIKSNPNSELGDYEFRQFFQSKNGQTIEEKRQDLSLIAYQTGIGKEYTQHLNGKPVYEPHVIVLCSPQTFSAAYHFLYFLSEIGDATIVGVPSSQAGNSFMETTPFELPRTKISGSISNAKQVFFPDDEQKGKIFIPDFSMTWEDFAKYDFDKNAEVLYCLDLIKQKQLNKGSRLSY